MKFIKSKIVTILTLSAIIAFTACSKDDGAVPKRVTIEDVPALTVNLDPAKTNNRDTIKLANPAAFSTKFNVSMIFPGQAAPTKIDVVVRKNALNTQVKVFKAGVTAFPTGFTVTAADIVALFGPLALNDTYDFAPDIYVGDKKYEVYPAVGLGNGAGITGQNAIGYWESVRVIVK